MPIYDLNNIADCLRLAADQPNRYRRQAVVSMLKRRGDGLMAQAVIEGLHRIARERKP